MSNRRVLVWALAVGVHGWLAQQPVNAQTYTGQLRGTVRANDGTALADVPVELVGEATGQVRTTRSNTDGQYVFASITPGTYVVQVVGGGSSALVRIGTQEFLALDLKLETGRRAEAVTVHAEMVAAPASASLGTTLDRRTIQGIPSVGRNAFLMSSATPGVLHTGDPQYVRQQDQTSSSLLTIAGAPVRANAYTLDGVPITDLRNRAIVIPGLESLEGVRVQVSTYDAEVGRTSGGVLNTTTRSGSNAWHGALLGQTRPRWGQGRLYLDRRACETAQEAGSACTPKPETHYYLYGGSGGGPLVRDRTFLWASFEGYRTRTARNTIVTLPTERERRGDFSQSPVTIYDPLTTRPDGAGGYVRDPFPGNVIPVNRLNPVALAALQYLPLPTHGNTLLAVPELEDAADQATLKLDHRFGPRLLAAATYVWYSSREPEALNYGGEPGENPGDPGEVALYRTAHVLAANATFIAGPNRVLTARYGLTSFADNDRPGEFDPGSLGFSDRFLGQIGDSKFPNLGIDGYASLGARPRQDNTYYSHFASLGCSALLGRHAARGGIEMRVLGLRSLAGGQSTGAFRFTPDFTAGPEARASGTNAGSSIASFLLGLPASGEITVASPAHLSARYLAAYVHDDLRVGSNLSLSLGVRIEQEDGLAEEEDRITVGFDRDQLWPIQVSGMELRGGLLYAGVDGAPRRQGAPSGPKLAPRVGLVWSPDAVTRVRGGWGRYWAPHQYGYPDSHELGTRGFTAVTPYVASIDGGLTPCPGCSLTDPFPQGVQQPRGNADGLLTGAGGSVAFIDQFREWPRVDRFSLDLQRDLPHGFSASVGYVGSRTEQASINSSGIDINQLDPRHLALGPALYDPVPNPFFGDSRFGSISLAATIPRAQILRPYPQFTEVWARQASQGRAQYHALVMRLQRPLRGGWGGDVNWTFGALYDNLFAEGSYSNGVAGAPVNSRQLDAEWSRSSRDTPHRVNVVALWEMPVGKGRRWLPGPGPWRSILGGWTLSLSGYYQSGFPIAVVMDRNESGLTSTVQRPDLTGLPPATTGSTEARLSQWLDSRAWSAPGPFAFGNAPRTDTRVRTPSRRRLDVALQKAVRVGRTTTTLRAELINALDDADFYSPATRLGAPDFGRINGVTGFPRMLQVMARVGF